MDQADYIFRQVERRRAGKINRCVVNKDWLPYPVTTPYGATGNPAWSLGRHTGEDHACPTGSRVVSVSWGEVICVARWSGGFSPPDMDTHPASRIAHWGSAFGTQVVIRTATGLYDVGYCHLSKTIVRPGDRVRPGEVIGLSGHSGGSGAFGPHLHLEVRPAGGRFGSDVRPMLVKRLRRGKNQ